MNRAMLGKRKARQTEKLQDSLNQNFIHTTTGDSTRHGSGFTNRSRRRSRSASCVPPLHIPPPNAVPQTQRQLPLSACSSCCSIFNAIEGTTEACPTSLSSTLAHLQHQRRPAPPHSKRHQGFSPVYLSLDNLWLLICVKSQSRQICSVVY